MVLAWILMLFAPVAAGAEACRRHTAGGSAPPIGAGARQIVAAGLLTNLVGALLVTVSGTGTIAATLTAPWLRNWPYRGHPLAGVEARTSGTAGLADAAIPRNLTAARAGA
jgi:hypothetical protein